MFMNDFKDDKIILYVNKDVVKNVNKGMFEAVVPE